MSITRSIEFYAGEKCVPSYNLFGGYYLDYQFREDIAYTDISFLDMADKLRDFMVKNNIKVGYCDVSADFGGGYSLFKRYTFINTKGAIITKNRGMIIND